jgi:superfamily II DNA or RNA helicase
MKTKIPYNGKQPPVVFTSTFDLLIDTNAHKNASRMEPTLSNSNDDDNNTSYATYVRIDDYDKISLYPSRRRGGPAIEDLRFPFLLKPDQIKAVDAWMSSGRKGSLLYGSGTGKTEIAFECARQAAQQVGKAQFRIVMLVPRIVLIEQNYRRLVKYGISPENIGVYFGERKESREITICTFNSATNSLEILKSADMVILDEVHLVRNTTRAFRKILDILSTYRDKALLGLTATLDEDDPRNLNIITILPPVRKYPIRDAVQDGRLAKPVIIPIGVSLTREEQELYDNCTTKIKRISSRFNRYDFQSMIALLHKGGFPSWQARAWFLNVRKRKVLLASAENKLMQAVELITTKHPHEKVMVFSETLESVRKLRKELWEKRIGSMIIDSSMPSYKRQHILSQWGTKFYPLLSVHTLEIGYDVPEVNVEIILASTSNINQVVQRIGRVLRKYKDKEHGLVYVIYVQGTKDDNLLSIFQRAIESSGGEESKGFSTTAAA